MVSHVHDALGVKVEIDTIDIQMTTKLIHNFSFPLFFLHHMSKKGKKVFKTLSKGNQSPQAL